MRVKLQLVDQVQGVELAVPTAPVKGVVQLVDQVQGVELTGIKVKLVVILVLVLVLVTQRRR